MAGRINSAVGTDLNAPLINCFVQPIADTFSGYLNGVPGIYQAAAEAGETMCRGGEIGYNFTQLRPRGSLVRCTGSTASGPASYMHVFDTACKTGWCAPWCANGNSFNIPSRYSGVYPSRTHPPLNNSLCCSPAAAPVPNLGLLDENRHPKVNMELFKDDPVVSSTAGCFLYREALPSMQ